MPCLKSYHFIIFRSDCQKLLLGLKMTVEGLLAAQSNNIWSMYGGLSRLCAAVEAILVHRLKVYHYRVSTGTPLLLTYSVYHYRVSTVEPLLFTYSVYHYKVSTVSVFLLTDSKWIYFFIMFGTFLSGWGNFYT